MLSPTRRPRGGKERGHRRRPRGGKERGHTRGAGGEVTYRGSVTIISIKVMFPPPPGPSEASLVSMFSFVYEFNHFVV